MFFEAPRRGFVVWADNDRIQWFIDRLNRAGYASLPPTPFADPQKGESAHFVECPGIPAKLALAMIDKITGPSAS